MNLTPSSLLRVLTSNGADLALSKQQGKDVLELCPDADVRFTLRVFDKTLRRYGVRRVHVEQKGAATRMLYGLDEDSVLFTVDYSERPARFIMKTAQSLVFARRASIRR